MSVLLFSVDSGTSSHITRMREVFLSGSKTYSDYHVTCGVDTIHVVKGVGTVLFQLDSRGTLEVAGVMHVRELKMNLVSVSNLEGKVYGIRFQMLMF